jgi:hypothetical protein
LINRQVGIEQFYPIIYIFELLLVRVKLLLYSDIAKHDNFQKITEVSIASICNSFALGIPLLSRATISMQHHKPH